MASTISSLISSAEGGDRSAADALFAALYSELHRLAKRQMARSGAGGTIGATTLLHEAYLDISQREAAVFPDRGRFMAYAAKVMRGLIIDYARSRQANYCYSRIAPPLFGKLLRRSQFLEQPAVLGQEISICHTLGV